jgi:pyridoxamine 5'-phosphate oxidase
MSTATIDSMTETLPDPLPANPLILASEWLAQARTRRRAQPNPNSMVLATVDARGQPSARVVLCKEIAPPGFIVFYTNYQSRKGRELMRRIHAPRWCFIGITVTARCAPRGG